MNINSDNTNNKVRYNLMTTQPTKDAIIRKCGSKSAAIRYLNALGWSRVEIAEFLDLRYQHVRTVLITPLTSDKSED